MKQIWSWISLRCSSLRWKLAFLPTFMVVLIFVAMYYLIPKITVVRVLEHELVDLADDTNNVIWMLRMDLARAKEAAVLLAARLSDIEDEAATENRFRVLARELMGRSEQPTEEQRKQPPPPVKHCLQAELFLVSVDAEILPHPIPELWEFNPKESASRLAFVKKFAGSLATVAFSPPRKHPIHRTDSEPPKVAKDGDRFHLVVDVAARVPKSPTAKADAVGRIVVLTLSLSGLDGVIPDADDQKQTILDQARSSPRSLWFARNPQSELLLTSELLLAPTAVEPEVPRAIKDGFQILEFAAHQEGEKGEDVDTKMLGELKTDFATDWARKCLRSEIDGIRVYGWTFDSSNRSKNENELPPTRYFCFTKQSCYSLLGKEKKAIEKRLNELRQEHRDCRFSDPSGDTPRIKVCADRKATLELVKNTLGKEFSGLEWETTIDCKHYGIHFLRVQFDPSEDSSSKTFRDQSFVDLASAAALEEITSDVNAEIWGQLIYAVWFVTAAILLAAWLSMAITTPLAKINASTERIAAGNYDVSSLPVTDGSEIGALARSFEKMVEQIKERNAEIHEADLRNRSVVQQAAEGIIQCSATGEIQEINDAALQIFGYSLEEVRNRPFDLLLQHETGDDHQLRRAHSGAHSSAVNNLAQMTTSCSTIVGQRKDGSLFPLEVSVKQVRVSDRLTLFTIIARDITERKRMTHELQELNEQLEQRVKRRTAELERKQLDLEAARDQALEASHAKSAFLAHMSHELRTPLNSIIGFSELLIDDAQDEGNDAILPDLRKIVDSGRHLLKMINSVLDLSKVEAGKMELCLEEFDIAEEIRGVVTMMEPDVQKNSNTLRVECSTNGCRMYADRTYVRQVLSNLLSNACKFTDHGQVELEVTVDRARGMCRFRISDSGIGMSPDQLARLFQSFSQADASTTRKYGGTGLGLAISQRICHLMAGEITVTSEKGGGSIFTVDLPLQVAGPTRSDLPEVKFTGAGTGAGAKPADPNGDVTDSRTSGQTVLVIDDDPAVREVLDRILVREGLHVVTASSGEAGLKAAREVNPDVITLDVMMPHMDGWEVLGRLKADVALRHIPVVMLSIVDDKQFGFTLGATDYLTKPIDRDRLISVLRRYLPDESPTVLIVEDDPNTREVLSRILSGEGWKTVEAENGREGLDRLPQAQPSLIVLDLIMPEMDGFQFLTELRQQPRWSGVPVLVLTAMELTPTDREWLNGRVMQVLNKYSYKLEEIITEVKRAIAMGRKMDHAETVAGGR